MAEQRKQSQENQNKSQGGKPNRVIRMVRTAWGFYGMLIEEAFLSAVFVLPFWAVFYFMGVDHITLPVNFPTLWGIMLLVFLLQNTMWGRR